jgi:hypothetical protein
MRPPILLPFSLMANNTPKINQLKEFANPKCEDQLRTLQRLNGVGNIFAVLLNGSGGVRLIFEFDKGKTTNVIIVLARQGDL